MICGADEDATASGIHFGAPALVALARRLPGVRHFAVHDHVERSAQMVVPKRHLGVDAVIRRPGVRAPDHPGAGPGQSDQTYDRQDREPYDVFCGCEGLHGGNSSGSMGALDELPPVLDGPSFFCICSMSLRICADESWFCPGPPS